MDAKILPIRCKTKTGIVSLNYLTEESTIGDLKEAVLQLTKISPERLRIRRGYPPVTVNLENNSSKILDVLSSPKEIIIIEEINISEHLSSSSSSSSSSVTMPPPSTLRSSPQPSTSFKSSTCSIKPKESINKSESSKGVLLRRVVPANNSCLFTSINFCLTNGRYEESSGTSLRKIIANTVAGDPIFYNEAFLGKSNSDYVKWILNDNHWGGAIEISILSNHYSIEIVVVDTQNTRLNRFGEDRDYSNRILIIYDGIHYDPLMFEPVDRVNRMVTIFPITDDFILSMALELASEAKASRQFTDVQNFTLKCLTCNTGLQGQIGARQHAMETGHINFGEI
ncbi:ubiquitin thioesterase OTU1-like [Panonychus citri]|uniref:ubiquitin thioesterase OTU1-like n=1 Tax=Panonychus citri TaxID=50023 RepID=UPI0023074F4B|nr:ubiquitin thioesterase OTU1-like [Panonychus citri]